jgi:hypothetical protein
MVFSFRGVIVTIEDEGERRIGGAAESRFGELRTHSAMNSIDLRQHKAP